MSAGSLEVPSQPCRRVTYSPNVFVPLARACTQSCLYCGFRSDGVQDTVLPPSSTRLLLGKAAAAGCTEALFTHGQDPDTCPGVGALLRQWGFSDMHSYLAWACRQALGLGLLPHANPGVTDRAAIHKLRGVCASMGLMLETTARVPAHYSSPKKRPDLRIEVIELAGMLRIPFTTGLLIGIGETWADRDRDLTLLGALSTRYRHIQEVILQPVVSNPMFRAESPSLSVMQRVVTMARKRLPDDVAIQVPANLFSPRDLPFLLDAGASDLGGISPITPDYVNPDRPWPQISALGSLLAGMGRDLVARLPVYEQYLSREWIGSDVWQTLLLRRPHLATGCDPT